MVQSFTQAAMGYISKNQELKCKDIFREATLRFYFGPLYGPWSIKFNSRGRLITGTWVQDICFLQFYQ